MLTVRKALVIFILGSALSFGILTIEKINSNGLAFTLHGASFYLATFLFFFVINSKVEGRRVKEGDSMLIFFIISVCMAGGWFILTFLALIRLHATLGGSF